MEKDNNSLTISFIHNTRNYDMNASSFLSSPFFFSEYIKLYPQKVVLNDIFDEEIFSKAIRILDGGYEKILNSEIPFFLDVVKKYKFHHLLPIIQIMTEDSNEDVLRVLSNLTVEQIYNNEDSNNLVKIVDSAISIDHYKALSIIDHPRYTQKLMESPEALKLLENTLSNDFFDVSIKPKLKGEIHVQTTKKEEITKTNATKDQNSKEYKHNEKTNQDQSHVMVVDPLKPSKFIDFFENEDRASIKYKIFRLSKCFVPDLFDQSINFFVRDVLRVLLDPKFRRSRLSTALERDDIDEIRKLRNYKIIDEEADGVNILHMAVMYEATDCIAFLTDMFGRVPNKYGISPHHVAAIADGVVSLSILLENLPNDLKDPYGQSIDHYLAHFSDSSDSILFFLRDHNIRCGLSDNYGQNSIILSMISRSNLLLVPLISLWKFTNEEKLGFLNFAKDIGNENAVKIMTDDSFSSSESVFNNLLETKGVKPGDKTCEDIVQILERVNNESLTRIEKLIERIKRGFQEESILYIISRLAQTIDINISIDGESIFILMIKYGFGFESLNKVVELGARMDIASSRPAYPIYYIAKYSNKNVFNHFVEKNGRELNRPSNAGKVLIHWSIEHESEELGLDIMKMILDADPTQLVRSDNIGRTTLHVAVENVKVGVLKEILYAYTRNRGIYPEGFVNRPDFVTLNTALHTACTYSNWDMIKILLLFPDADLYAEDIRGCIPIQNAASPDVLKHYLRKFRRNRSFRNKLMKACEEFLNLRNSRK